MNDNKQESQETTAIAPGGCGVMPVLMSAEDMVTQFGEELIGKRVLTEEYGDWPGGIAVITEINPDPNAPEISFQVKSKHGEIGVFWHETCEFEYEEQA